MSSEKQVLTLGRRIAQARAEAGLTQIELGKRVGHASRTVQSWEADERHPRFPALQDIASALDREIAWFYTNYSLEEAA